MVDRLRVLRLFTVAYGSLRAEIAELSATAGSMDDPTVLDRLASMFRRAGSEDTARWCDMAAGALARYVAVCPSATPHLVDVAFASAGPMVWLHSALLYADLDDLVYVVELGADALQLGYVPSYDSWGALVRTYTADQRRIG